MVINDDNELALRVRNRTEGFRDVQRALAWNKQIQERPLVTSEHRIDNTHNEPKRTLDVILRLAQGG
jgi:hypothetical protein